MQIDTDPKKIEKLLTRGVENIYPNKEFLEERLKSGKQISLYTGYDPTGPTLHIGHAVTMMKLRQFQDLGHQIIMLIGDFTGMIGDPTDKTSARQKLTREEVLKNCTGYQKQASSILNFDGENPVVVKYNSEWYSKMGVADMLELTSHFTVSQLLERDMFKKRIEDKKPIYVHEFLYPTMQGYDSVAMDVDGEIGGNDQTFNMLAGRDLMKSMGKKEKFVLTTKLLADTSGKKMGKSEGNMIALIDSAEDMLGKVMSWTDGMILSGFELCTYLEGDEIKDIKEKLESGENPRDIKLQLAFEIVKIFLSEDDANRAKDHFIATFSKKEIPDDILELKPTVYNVITMLTESKICKSGTEARQVIDQGGVKVNDKKVEVKDYFATVEAGDIIKKGSRWFARVQ